MRSETLGDPATAGPIDDSIKLILQMTAGDGDAVCGDGPALPAVTSPQALLEHGLHPRGKPAVTMIANQRATSSQQMRDAGLMHGLGESTIRRPAVADQQAVKIG